MPSALRRLALTATALAMAATATVAVTSPASAAVGTLSLLGTTAAVPHGWDSVEHWNDTDPQWPATHYLSDGRQNQTGETATLFGSPKPPGSQFLLYRAPGWHTNAGAPVLLVMGANDDVDREYSDPAAGGAGTCGVTVCPSSGLMQLLSGEGFRVFAVDFADTQGDNLEWAQTISDALSRVQTETGTTSVDLVSWSKGAFAARMYVAGVAPTWGRPYQGDVHKLVLIGNPNGGLDYTFAHGTEGNPLIYPECGGTLNGPSPSQSYVCFGLLRSEPNLAITSQFFTGQRQMLARWDTTFGVDETQDDWETTYYGGTGFISISKGIQQAINAGSLVATIQATPTPATVPTYLLCGSAPTILGFFNEDRGPSDGVVFDASCTSTKGIGDVAGNTLIATDNHLMLGWESTAMHTVSGWLSS